MKKLYNGSVKFKTKVAVIIIGYNEESILGKCLDSVLAASRIFEITKGENVEILYIDSFSTDNSVSIAREKGIRVAFAPKRFHTANNGRMTGLILTDSEYVMFLDGDMELDAKWLEVGTAFLGINSNAAGVLGIRDDMRYKNGSYILIPNYYGISKKVEPFSKVDGGACLLRRCALNDIGGIEPDISVGGEEPVMYCRLRSAGWALSVINRPMIVHWDFRLSSFKESLRLLICNKQIAITGVILRRAIFHEHWSVLYLLHVKRDLMLHMVWVLFMLNFLCGIMMDTEKNILWETFGLGTTLLYGLTVWRSKKDWQRTTAAFLLRTVYLLYMVGGCVLNRPKVEFGVQKTEKYRREVFEINEASGERT